MAADPRAATGTPTDDDRAAYGAILDLAGRFGPDRAAASAVYASGTPLWPHVLLAAARNTTVDDVVQVLRLDPGQLADVVNVAIPTPAPPLPPDQATTFPADDDDAPDPAPGPYASRWRLVLLRDVSEPTAAALAVCVPGRVGVILFMIARGDAVADVAEVLKISVDDIDAALQDQAGHHVTRPDG